MGSLSHPQGNLSNPRIERRCPALQADSWPAESQVKLLSRVWLFTTPWTVTYQAPPTMGFSRQEYWSGLTFPSPGDLPNPGIKPRTPAWQADALPYEPPGKLVTRESQVKPNNTGVGSLSLLQGIYLTQESNRGLLHCRRILYTKYFPRTQEQKNEQDSVLVLKKLILVWKTRKKCMINTELSKLFLKGSERKYFRLYWPKAKSRLLCRYSCV